MQKSETLQAAPAVSFPYDNPYPWYRSMRSQSPFHRLGAGQWLVSGYAEAMALLQHPLCSHWGQDIETQAMMTPFQKAVARTLALLAPGQTPAYHKMIMHQLAARNLKAEEDYLRKLSARIIQRLKLQDEIEFVSQYAHPLTFGVISHLMGIPDERAEELTEIVDAMDGQYLPIITGEAHDQSGEKFLTFLEELIAYKQHHRGTDLTSQLLSLSEGNGEAREVVLPMMILLFYAGHENMMNFLGNAVVALQAHPAIQSSLRQHPTQMEAAVDELLRYDSPLQFIILYAKDDIDMSGKIIPGGSQLLIGVGAANRDEKMFAQPDQLDLARRPVHLSFGAGAFRCIGAKLARMEAIVGLEEFLGAQQDLPLPEVVWRKSSFVQRGPLSLHFKPAWIS